MKLRSVSNKIYVTIDTRIFSQNVIQKCFYWYTSDYLIEFNFNLEHYIEVVLASISDSQIDEIALQIRISQDLNDFYLRELVNQQTGTIRDLIVAKAFANFEEAEAEFSSADIADPLGFKL
jgi:His-Xaa-Ser system protein HxsD